MISYLLVLFLGDGDMQESTEIEEKGEEINITNTYLTYYENPQCILNIHSYIKISGVSTLRESDNKIQFSTADEIRSRYLRNKSEVAIHATS